MIKILGIDDSVNSCDCCGRIGLKSTIIVEVDGEQFNFGQICATKHTGMSSSKIKSEISNILTEKIKVARQEYYSTKEYQSHQEKLKQLHKEGVGPGKEFLLAQQAYSDASSKKLQDIITKYGLIDLLLY